MKNLKKLDPSVIDALNNLEVEIVKNYTPATVGNLVYEFRELLTTREEKIHDAAWLATVHESVEPNAREAYEFLKNAGDFAGMEEEIDNEIHS